MVCADAAVVQSANAKRPAAKRLAAVVRVERR
jgi:hypothetical protein